MNREYHVHMRPRSSLIILAIALVGCTSTDNTIHKEYPPFGIKAISRSSSSKEGRFVSSVVSRSSSSDEDGFDDAEGRTLVPDEKQARVLTDSGENYLAILATFPDRESAKRAAVNLGAWVLPTDLTESLTPGLYAVVHGPFSDPESAKLYGVPGGYVKNAGKFLAPADLPFDPAGLPIGVLQAVLGEVDLSFLSAKPFIELSSHDGTFCRNHGNSFQAVFSFTKPYTRRIFSDKALAWIKQRGFTTPQQDVTSTALTLWTQADTGEISFQIPCFD